MRKYCTHCLHVKTGSKRFFLPQIWSSFWPRSHACRTSTLQLIVLLSLIALYNYRHALQFRRPHVKVVRKRTPVSLGPSFLKCYKASLGTFDPEAVYVLQKVLLFSHSLLCSLLQLSDLAYKATCFSCGRNILMPNVKRVQRPPWICLKGWGKGSDIPGFMMGALNMLSKGRSREAWESLNKQLPWICRENCISKEIPLPVWQHWRQSGGESIK